MRYPERVMRAIYDKYVPRVDNKPDPNVLYVGPFIDGITLFIPELLAIAFPRNPQGSQRRHFKTILSETGLAVRAGERARMHTIRDFAGTMSRPAWKRSKTVALTDLLRGGEPGELLNSYEVHDDFETGAKTLVEKVKGGDYKPFVPAIREDKQWGLHFLLRGDKLSFSFKTRKGDPVLLNYELRPAVEGTSLLTPERSMDVVPWGPV